MIGPWTDVQRQSFTTYISLRSSLHDGRKCGCGTLLTRMAVNMNPVQLLTGALLATATAATQLEWDHDAYRHSPDPTEIPNRRSQTLSQDTVDTY